MFAKIFKKNLTFSNPKLYYKETIAYKYTL